MQEISEFHVNRCYLSVGCHPLLRVKGVFPPSFKSPNSETPEAEGGFTNLRTLRGTLESKLQRNRVQGMLGFVVPGSLCCVLGSVVPPPPQRTPPGMLGNVVPLTSHSATRSHLRALVCPALGAGPSSLCRFEANPPLGQTLSNKT